MSRPPEPGLPLGFIRDKTSTYVGFRSQPHHGATPAGLSSAILSPDSLGPRADSSLVRRADNIDSQFITLDNALTDLRSLYDERLRPSFDSRVTLDSRIEAETSRISQLITRVRDDIRGTARVPSGQRHQLEKAMQQGHASRLRALTLQFREMQTAYLTRLQASEQRDADDSDSIDTDVTFSGSQVGQIQAQRQDIEERNAQIQRLLPMISQLTEMFADLGTLIVAQGTMLDRIDGLLDAALDDMRDGNVDLRKAEGDQKRSTKWFICYMVLMIVLILILGTVIMVRKGNNEEPEATPNQ